MKKRLAIILLSIILLPCMVLLAACKDEKPVAISSIEFSNRLLETGKNFFKNYGKEDLTINTSITNKTTWKENISYVDRVEAGLEHSQDYNFQTTQTINVKIEIDNYELNQEELVSYKITINMVEIEKGVKQTVDTFGVETFTNTIRTNMVSTMVKDGENFKIFELVTTKENEEAAETNKAFYTFENMSEYNVTGEQLLSVINEGFFVSFFNIDINSVAGINYYALGETYGYNMENAATSFNEYIATKTYSKISSEYNKNIPVQTNVYINNYVEEVFDRKDFVGDMNIDINLLQSCEVVSVPTGFEEAIESPTLIFPELDDFLDF